MSCGAGGWLAGAAVTCGGRACAIARCGVCVVAAISKCVGSRIGFPGVTVPGDDGVFVRGGAAGGGFAMKGPGIPGCVIATSRPPAWVFSSSNDGA